MYGSQSKSCTDPFKKNVNFTKHLHKMLAFLFVLLTKLLSNYLYKGHLVAK